MIRLSVVAFGLLLLSIIGFGQDPKTAKAPFNLTWTEGRCVACRTAARLEEIQFVSRKEVWAVGSKSQGNGVNAIVVHSMDAGRTWREVPQSRQYTDPDGRLAFSFPDAADGWISSWANLAGEPTMITTRDHGEHWQNVSHQFLQSMQFTDDRLGYGAVAEKFFRTNDGGRSWVGSKIPGIAFIDRLVFLTPDHGWIAGVNGKDFVVFRTVNRGTVWEQSRTTPVQSPEAVRDLFFVDLRRGWLVTTNHNDEGTYLYSTVDGGEHWTPDPNPAFQGNGMQGITVRFTSRETGFVFCVEGNAQSRLVYTTDGGIHWHKQALPRVVFSCQVFDGDVLCSSAGFRLLRVHPN